MGVGFRIFTDCLEMHIKQLWKLEASENQLEESDVNFSINSSQYMRDITWHGPIRAPTEISSTMIRSLTGTILRNGMTSSPLELRLNLDNEETAKSDLIFKAPAPLAPGEFGKAVHHPSHWCLPEATISTDASRLLRHKTTTVAATCPSLLLHSICSLPELAPVRPPPTPTPTTRHSPATDPHTFLQ